MTLTFADTLHAATPPGLALRPFQEAGVAQLLYHGRVILGDEPGLGKTVQALMAVKLANARGTVAVVPASLKSNWRREAAKWLPGWTVAVLNGRDAHEVDADLVVINYDILADWAPFLTPAALIVDESHYVKNPNAKRTQAVLELSKRVPAEGLVIELTGTPTINRAVELEQQLKVAGKLDPQGRFLGKSYKYFWAGAPTRDNPDGRPPQADLNDRLREHGYVRREKADVLTELPEKSPRADVWVNNVNLTRYNRAEEDLIEFLRAEKGSEAARKANKAEAIVLLNTLRQLVGEAKIDGAIEWADNFLQSGRSLVLFAAHVEVQNRLIEGLGALGYDVTHILGGQGCSENCTHQKGCAEAHKARFLAGTSKVIVCSLKAAREGHTLISDQNRATDVVFVEQGWTPGEHIQAEDRIHRIGQNDHVQPWYLLVENTVDEYLAAIIEQKRRITTLVNIGLATEAEVEAEAASVQAALLDAIWEAKR